MVGTTTGAGGEGFYPRQHKWRGPVEASVRKIEKLNTKSPLARVVTAARSSCFRCCETGVLGWFNHGKNATRLNHIESLVGTFELGGGGIKSLRNCGPATAYGLTQRFFIGLGALNFSTAIKEIKRANHFKHRPRREASQSVHLFSGCGRDRIGSEKLPRNSGWGGR